MRIFGGDRLKSMMGKMGWEEGEELTNRFMSKAVERAQVRVETRNFDIRKNLLIADWAAEEGIADEEMLSRLKKSTDDAFTQLTSSIDENEMHRVEKQLLLQVIDQNWREHLQQLDNLKSVIGMRAYGQRDPLNEYKSEAFTLFGRARSERAYSR